MAAFLQPPDELVNLRVPHRGQLLPGLGLERGEEIVLGEQQVLGIVKRQPEPGLLAEGDQRQVNDQGGEGVESGSPDVLQRVLVIRVTKLRGRGLPGELRNPDPVEIDQAKLNGGGEKIVIRTTSGTIRLKKGAGA